MAIKVNIEVEQTSAKGIKASCKKVLAKALEHLQVNNCTVTLILTNDEAIAKINKTYRNKKGPTDVISFAYREAPMPIIDTQEHLGDIFISVDTAQRQAKEYNVSLQEELQRLIVHGVLHLLGYDHEKSSYKKRVMQKKEEEILALLH